MTQQLCRLSGFLVMIFAAAASSRSAVVDLSASTKPAAVFNTPGPAVVIRLTGEVDNYQRDQLFRRFAKARTLGAKTIILEIDTYGGLVTSGLDISRFLKNQTDLHVIAFVNSKAISAGAMIALACDEIVMTPSGTLGDCAPIQVAPGVGGMVSMEPTERSKAESPILSDFQESAYRNGYDPLLACAMVSLPYSVHWIQDDAGTRRFVNDVDYKTLTESGKWHAIANEPDPIDSDKTLLTVHTAQALRYGLARGTALTSDELAIQRGVTILDRLEDGIGDGIISMLGGSVARALFLIIFLNALFLALKTPGSGAPEAIALVALGLLIGIPLLTGHALWWQILMIVAGIGLVVFEIFVFPGHLVSLLLGSVLLLSGIVLTFVGDVWSVPGGWSLAGTQASVERGTYVTVGGLAISLLTITWLRRQLVKLPYFKNLVLTTVSGEKSAPASPPSFYAGQANSSTDIWPFVGTTGAATTELKPGGIARFPYGGDARTTSVVSESGFVPAGTRVIVREVHGNRVVVRVL